MNDLTRRERAVIQAMRESERAEGAIYKYAVNFAGDRQAMDTKRMTGEYGKSYE